DRQGGRWSSADGERGWPGHARDNATKTATSGNPHDARIRQGQAQKRPGFSEKSWWRRRESNRARRLTINDLAEIAQAGRNRSNRRIEVRNRYTSSVDWSDRRACPRLR